MNIVKKIALEKGRNHPIVSTYLQKQLLEHYLTQEELDFERFRAATLEANQ